MQCVTEEQRMNHFNYASKKQAANNSADPSIFDPHSAED